MEIVAGNWGLNSQFKVSQQMPIELYAGDFDKNGVVDPILTYYVGKEKYPFMTRDELQELIPDMRRKFNNYAGYSKAKLEDILNGEQIASASTFSAGMLGTTLFKLNKEGRYSAVPLPKEVQYAPIFNVTSMDVDKDGKKDLLFLGNMRHARLRIGNMDANLGLLLRGKGQLQFEVVPQMKTGMWLRADVRSLAVWKNKLYLGLSGMSVQEYTIK
jgi:hypothetical protein